MSECEKNLLQQITIGMPEQSWQRYHLLITKLEAETLQPDEQQELSQIIEQREEANVRRIDARTYAQAQTFRVSQTLKVSGGKSVLRKS